MDIEHLFKMSALQPTRTGRQVCCRLEEETECDQDLSRTLFFMCFRRECSCLCGGHVMTLPILLPGYVGLPAAYRPYQSRTLVYCLNILCHSVLYLWTIISQ